MLLGLAVLLAGCSLASSTASGGKPRVATSITVFADMARAVAGDRATVASLVPPGADVHTYEPTPQDVQTLTGANVVIFNGLGFEEPLAKTLRANAGQGTTQTRLVELFTTAIPKEQQIAGEDPNAAGVPNLHPWLDPKLGVRYIQAIRDALVGADPDGRTTYEANAERYVRQVEDVDREVEAMVAPIPPERRKLVTFHSAFPYLARRYNLTLVGVVVASTDREPSAADVAELSRKIRSEGVPAVYGEPQVNARTLELVARDAGVRMLGLYSDALDDTVKTYLDMLRYNGRQLAEGLR